MTRWNKLFDHFFQDSPLFSEVFYKLSPSETGHAFINLADPAALFPEDLRPDVIDQETNARISLKGLYLSSFQPAMEINASLGK